MKLSNFITGLLQLCLPVTNVLEYLYTINIRKISINVDKVMLTKIN
jgi:hypothetical protein